MFRKITSLLILAAAVFSATAQDADMGLASNERVLGYTLNNQIDQTAGLGEAGTYTVGARLYAEDLKPYAGCKVKGLRIAAGTNLGRSRTFVYTIDGGEIKLAHEQNQRIRDGWNRVDFNGFDFTIGKDSELFFGYDYVETAEMIASRQFGMAAAGSDTYGASMVLEDGRLYTLSGFGKLCVQLIIDITDMPPYNVAFGFFDTGFKYKKTTEDIEVMTTLRNVGRDHIKKLRMGWQFDNLPVQYADLDVNMAAGGSYTWNQTLAKPDGMGVGSRTLKIFPVKADGIDIPVTDENTRTEAIALYENTLPREHVLIETYTNSSSAAMLPFNSVLNQFGDYNGKAIVATHHMPGTPLATAESQVLFDRYAFGTPVFTSNRTYFPGEQTIAYNANDFIGLLPDDMCVAFFQEIVEQDITFPNFASLSAQGLCVNDNATLNLEVTIDALPEASAIYGTLALHVMLVEDQVRGPQAATGIGGKPVTNNNYTHFNVVRLHHTGVKGHPVVMENNTAKVNFEIPMDKSWNPQNMRAVIYITKYFDQEIPANLKDADVTNAISLPLGPISAIREVSADSTADGPSTYFTIGGVEVGSDNLAPGLYIERRADGTARKVLIK